MPAPVAAPVAGLAALRVLVADDNAVNQKLAVLLLEKMGHQVVVAHNGQEALEQAQAQRFDLVLMDMHMPVMDGTDSARSIRALPHPAGQVPIIALTANAMAEARLEASQAGMNDFLVKPVRFDELKAAVERYGYPG
jgi:CheY-like chemotaxis protein